MAVRDDEHGPRIFFSWEEIGHLALGSTVLTLAFALVLGIRTGGAFVLPPGFDFSDAPRLLFFSAIVVLPAFVLHEIAHKIVAQRKDMWAEFRASIKGLVVGFILTAGIGFLALVPGAVQIYGKGRDQALYELREARLHGDASEVAFATAELRDAARNEGIISVVGPILNLVLGYGALLLEPVVGPIRVSRDFGNLLEVIVLLNGILAAFNMLPIGPLDGRKVWHWSKLAFVGMWAMIVALALLILQSAYTI
ncbi:MAG: hypothetical protein QOE90_761 [Thermoplasmata archaeon]|jgi:Zn-dependent protease|nr:hypothetical protein [Thermoplasmata archaeon]